MYKTVENLVNSKTNKKQLLKEVSEAFSISEREVHKRVQSMFGKTVDELLTPTKEELTRAILQADDIDELKSLVKKDNGLSKLYDVYYGVSTFAAARKVCESYRETTPYNPTKADNLSILISQVIGDGSLEYSGDKPRNSLSITHCEKQYEYLVEKVKLINKAYPTTPPVGSIKKYKHLQGHTYFMYRTNKMATSDIDFVYKTTQEKLIHEMTPLGMFLLYMDDGCLTQSDNATKLTICNGVSLNREAIKDYLQSYGIVSTIYDKDMVVCISNTVNITKFLYNFVTPFKAYTPDSMGYKTKLMV